MAKETQITRGAIIAAAFALVRRAGDAALCARALAGELGCSTQPIFSNFTSMDEVRSATIRYTESFFADFSAQNTNANVPPYKATGLAYIRFAREERHLFRLLFMRHRQPTEMEEQPLLLTEAVARVSETLGYDADTALRFHLENWAFVHGLAVMFATEYLTWDMAFVSAMMTDVYLGLRTRFEENRT